jgi:cytochrome c peroxidase
MRSSTRSSILCAAFLALAALHPPGHPLPLTIPAGWPSPVYDVTTSPLSREGVALGRRLFYDPVLSRDSIISCSSCHLSYTAFTHVDHALSHGIHDSVGTRNSPALMNLAWSRHFMWDGAVNHLDMQALAPINHPAEMGETTARVVHKLRRGGRYAPLFAAAFGDTAITGERLLKSIAQFELTLVSANAKYDRVMAGSEQFTEQEANGLRLFRAHCATCHAEPLFTDGGFANNGLPMDTVLRDPGRMRITADPKDSLRFKVPTLRNIEFSFPYMHDGRFRSLRAVLDHYDHGIKPSATLDPRMETAIQLTSDERTDVIAFLLTLSDRDFLFNPEHAYPR